MQCHQCGEENRDLAKFCLGCGAKLAATNQTVASVTIDSACPSCQHHNPAGTKFCSKCGFGLLAAGTTAAAAASANPNTNAVELISTDTATPPTAIASEAVIAPLIVNKEPAPAAPAAVIPPTFAAPITENVLPPVSLPVATEPVIAAAVPTPSAHETIIAPKSVAPLAGQVPPPVPPQAENYSGLPPYEPKRAASPILKVGLAALLLITLGAGGWWYSQNKTSSSVATDDVRPDVGAVTATVPEDKPAAVVIEDVIEPAPTAEAAADVAVEDAAVSVVEAGPTPEEIAKRDAELRIKKEAAEQARKKREAAAIVKRQERQAEEQARAQARANNRQAVQPQNRVAPTVAPPSSLRDQVTSCKQRGYFEREKCLWSLCNNRWGTNGCPSYDN